MLILVQNNKLIIFFEIKNNFVYFFKKNYKLNIKIKF